MSASPLLIDFDNLRHKWGWLLTLGIVMVILGTIAFFITPAATIGTVIVLGWLLVISGIVELIQTFRMRAWGGIFLHLIGGILGILIGLLVVTRWRALLPGRCCSRPSLPSLGLSESSRHCD